CLYRKAGALQVVTSPVQLARLEEGIGHARRWGMGPDDLVLLSRDEAEQRVRVAGLLAASFTPHCAALDPARLVRGLARAGERRGGALDRPAGGPLSPPARRTPDGRMAFGGRGAPYHFGSRIRPAYDRDPAVHRRLE